MKKTISILLAAFFGQCLVWGETPEGAKSYEIAVYYWPNFHIDARNEEKLGKNWTEWELVKQAVPRFPGHLQPKEPMWGYTNEANPQDMARVIETMADHGITAADTRIEAGLLNMTNSQGQPASEVEKAIHVLGVNSVTSYTWAHYVAIPAQCSYEGWAQRGADHWNKAQASYPVSYFPHVSMGWDPSPRTDPKKPYSAGGYPYTGIVVGNTPEEFKKVLIRARAYLEKEPRAQRILTINSWNEWTEGSFLEPEKNYGMGYLDAIKDVFVSAPARGK